MTTMTRPTTPSCPAGWRAPEVDVVDDQEVPMKRRQSIAARKLRLIPNFVRRNVRALEHPAFRDGAGSGIVIPNVIVLNWVCWWVATKHEDRSGELVVERLRLGRLLWSSGDTGGYLGELDDDHRELVLERFDDQRFEADTLASMADVSHTDHDDADFLGLRDVLRRAVGDPCWQVSAQHLAPAARLVNGRPTTPEVLDAVGVAEAL